MTLHARRVRSRRGATIYRGAVRQLDPACLPVIERAPPPSRAIVAKGEPVYGINTGFGKLASVRIAAADLATLQRNIVLSHAAGVGEPMPRGGRAADDGAEARQPRRKARRACGRRRCAARGAARRTGDAGRALPGLGRRLGRPRAAGAYGGGDDRRRRGRSSTASACPPPRRSRDAGLAPLVLGAKEGLALLNGTQFSTAYALAGAVRGRDAVPGRRWSPARCRPMPRAAPTRRSTRASTRCAAIPARSRPPTRCARLMAGSRHPRLAPGRRRARAGPLLPALPAAGHGRRARPAAPGRDDAGDRSQRRHRQSADLRRRPARRCPAATSTPSRWPSPPT